MEARGLSATSLACSSAPPSRAESSLWARGPVAVEESKDYLGERWSHTAQCVRDLTSRKNKEAELIRQATQAERRDRHPALPAGVPSDDASVWVYGGSVSAGGAGGSATEAGLPVTLPGLPGSSFTVPIAHGAAGSIGAVDSIDGLLQSILLRSSAVSSKLVKSCALAKDDEPGDAAARALEDGAHLAAEESASGTRRRQRSKPPPRHPDPHAHPHPHAAGDGLAGPGTRGPPGRASSTPTAAASPSPAAGAPPPSRPPDTSGLVCSALTRSLGEADALALLRLMRESPASEAGAGVRLPRLPPAPSPAGARASGRTSRASGSGDGGSSGGRGGPGGPRGQKLGLRAKSHSQPMAPPPGSWGEGGRPSSPAGRSAWAKNTVSRELTFSQF